MMKRYQFAFAVAALASTLAPGAASQNIARPGASVVVGGAAKQQQATSSSRFLGAPNSSTAVSSWQAGKGNFGMPQDGNAERKDSAKLAAETTSTRAQKSVAARPEVPRAKLKDETALSRKEIVSKSPTLSHGGAKIASGRAGHSQSHQLRHSRRQVTSIDQRKESKTKREFGMNESGAGTSSIRTSMPPTSPATSDRWKSQLGHTNP